MMKKTICHNAIRLWILLISVLSLSSCHVEIHDEVYDPVRHLCDFTWHDSWSENRDMIGHQEFKFYPDGTGVEDFWFEDKYYGKVYEWNTYHFYWTRTSPNSIKMEYRDGVSFFERLEVDYDWMGGYLNGKYVDFNGY